MAKSDLGTLTIYMDAITDKFHAGMAGAEKSMTAFKGKIKGFNRTFTEMRNKVNFVTGAIEGLAKGLKVIGKVATGDFGGIANLIESLPFGIGAAASAVADLWNEWTGVNEEMRQIEKRQKAAEAHMAETLRLAKEFKDTMADISRATLPLTDETMVLRTEYDRIAAALADPSLSAEQLAVEVEKAAKAAAALSRDLVNEDAIHAIEDRIQALTDEADKYDAILAAEIKSGKAEDSTIELGHKVRNHREIIKSLEKQLSAEIEVQDVREGMIAQADQLAKRQEDAAKAAKDQLDRTKDLEKAQAKLASLTKKRESVSKRGVSGGSDTFSTPMGTISFPSMDETAALARLQLDELQAIDKSIQEATAKIGELGGVPNVAPITPASVAPITPASVAAPVSPAMEAAERVKRLAAEAQAERAAEADRVKGRARYLREVAANEIKNKAYFWNEDQRFEREDVKQKAGGGGFGAQKLAPKPPRMGAIKLPGLGSVAELGKKQLSQLEVIGTAVADVKTSITELSRA